MEFRRLTPSVNEIMAHPLMKPLSPGTASYLAPKIQDTVSTELGRQNDSFEPKALNSLVTKVVESTIVSWEKAHPVVSINATGVIVHTGLGRARLAPQAAEAVYNAASTHSTVEIDLESGQRGDRQAEVEKLLCEITEAEAALVVNNCAAALSLVCMALGTTGDILISRGEIIEIGGQFRLPKIIEVSGSSMSEVGCTNKTYVKDYAEAIEACSMVLRCHPSNYRVEGFTHSATTNELSDLAKANKKILVVDQGNGCFHDTSAYGLEHETTVQEEINSGADLVLFSGDKLLGGTQCGCIVGKKELIAQLKDFPLARAFRIDKLSLAGLAATLKLHLTGNLEDIPTWKAIMQPAEVTKQNAELVIQKLGDKRASLVECQTEVGGGTMPGQNLPSYGIALSTKNPNLLANALRNSTPAVFSIIRGGSVVLDLRTIEEKQEIPVLIEILKTVLKTLE